MRSEKEIIKRYKEIKEICEKRYMVSSEEFAALSILKWVLEIK